MASSHATPTMILLAARGRILDNMIRVALRDVALQEIRNFESTRRGDEITTVVHSKSGSQNENWRYAMEQIKSQNNRVVD